jgi:3-hydroxybutyryl-CoA dehydratase
MRWSAPFEHLSVGERFRSAGRVVCDTDLIVFSALTGDWHPQHCDPEWAAAGPFGERIAHGMLILSLTVGLVPFDPERVLALRRISNVVFKRPVRLDETISVTGELSALTPVDASAGLVDFRWAVHNQVDATVCRATVQVLWRRDEERAERIAERPPFWHDAVTGTDDGGFVPLPL